VLGHAGFVTAIERCLLVELATTPVLLILTRTLLARAREPEAAEDRVRTVGGELAGASAH
jgi:hypothetical protein